MTTGDRYQDVRLAVQLWPWCLERWKRLDELMPLLPRIGEPIAMQVVEEIKGLLAENVDEMMAFLALVVPREEFSPLWAYPDPASLRGTPIMELPGEKEERAARARVGANPLSHIYPALLTDIQARTLAGTVADLVVSRVRHSKRAANAKQEQAADVELEEVIVVEDVSENAAAAMSKYGSGVVALIERACRDGGGGIGSEALAEEVGIGVGHLRNNVLAPLRRLQLISYDESTRLWMTNSRKASLTHQRTQARGRAPGPNL